MESPTSSTVFQEVPRTIETRARRGQIEIFLEILTLTSPDHYPKGTTKTHLAYCSGLNFRRLEKYLELLLQRKLVELFNDKERKQEGGASGTYIATPSGERMRLILLEAEKLITAGDVGLDPYEIHCLSNPESCW